MTHWRRKYSTEDLRLALDMSRHEWAGVKEAASDARLTVQQYVRLMTLAAAGFGGLQEHLERAVRASTEV